MNKQLLFIFIVSFFYLACTEEAKVGNTFIESILLEDQKETELQDSLRNVQDGIQEVLEMRKTLKSDVSNDKKNTSSSSLSNKSNSTDLKTPIEENREISDTIEYSNNSNKNPKKGAIALSQSSKLDIQGSQYSKVKDNTSDKKQASKTDTTTKADQFAGKKSTIGLIKADSVINESSLTSNGNSSNSKTQKDVKQNYLDPSKALNTNKRNGNKVSSKSNNNLVNDPTKLSQGKNNNNLTSNQAVATYQNLTEQQRNNIASTTSSKSLNLTETKGERTGNKQVNNDRNDTSSENANARPRTDVYEPKITQLFTDPEAHSKKYVRPLQKSNRLVTNQLVEKQSEYIIELPNSNAYNGRNKSTDFAIKLLKKERAYETNKNYTLIFEIKNNGDAIAPLNLDIQFPEFWNIISISNIGSLNTEEKKLGVVSFYIPRQSPSGTFTSSIQLKTNNYILNSYDFELEIAPNYEVEVFNVSAPQQVQAGELITSSFGIKNKGNVDQAVELSSSNTIQGESNIIVPIDSTVIVEISQKTNSKANTLKRISTNLEVYNTASERKYYSTQSVEVIPSKIDQKDPYFRYPIQASLYYSSHTKNNDHYSTLSAELRGNGYLDMENDHHLNFIIRAPKKEDLRRFSIVDQYSLIYRYKNKTTLHLGDHSYYHNRLGFGSRYGMGFKVEHNFNKWTVSTFYSLPRLYNFTKKPLYGVRAVYHESDSLKLGLTLERSNGNNFFYRNSFNQDGKGQILTLDYKYLNKNTNVDAEVSASMNNQSVDFATDINFTQRFKNLSFSSNLILAGKNYLGTITNSLQVSNNLYYTNKGFNFGLGHATSRVNKRLDPIYFETEPYYEAYFATLGYRFSNQHFFNMRFDKREREDQLKPTNYHYKEYGLSYNFNYFNKLFTGSFGGRFAKTQNMLTANQNYRDSYSHHLNVSYVLFKNFRLRGGLNYMLTNRYGNIDLSTNYMRYNIGFNYSLMRRFSLNMNYNSGYSPEENYKRREYINLNLRANINQHHRFEVRANYFENPAVIDNKELFAYAKYTYSFGVGIKRLFEQGGIEGHIFTNNSDIDIKGIKLYTAGKTITTDKYGNFEMNNLELGINNIYIDDSSLPLNVVSELKNPIQVTVEKDKKTVIDIQLVKSGSLFGALVLNNQEMAIETNLESFVKLENDMFTYYTEARKDGSFKFQNIVPGDYRFSLIRFKQNGKLFTLAKETEITVKEEEDTEFQIAVKGKERKIKFKETNLKVGYND